MRPEHHPTPLEEVLPGVEELPTGAVGESEGATAQNMVHEFFDSSNEESLSQAVEEPPIFYDPVLGVKERLTQYGNPKVLEHSPHAETLGNEGRSEHR